MNMKLPLGLLLVSVCLKTVAVGEVAFYKQAATLGNQTLSEAIWFTMPAKFQTTDNKAVFVDKFKAEPKAPAGGGLTAKQLPKTFANTEASVGQKAISLFDPKEMDVNYGAMVVKKMTAKEKADLIKEINAIATAA